MSEVAELARILQATDPTPNTKLIQGVVASVQAGTITVTIEGVDIPGLHYLDSYTPSASDTVWLLKSGPDRLVIGAQA